MHLKSKFTSPLDTESTVGESFHEQHTRHLPLYPLDKILHIECADGGTLLCRGFIEATVTSPGLLHAADTSMHFPILVVSDSNYKDVPVLLGQHLVSPTLRCTYQLWRPVPTNSKTSRSVVLDILQHDLEI